MIRKAIVVHTGAKEILTYTIQKEKNSIKICIPVSGLINPKFSLIDNILYIFLDNYKQPFFIKNLKEETIEYIKNNNAYIVESLVYENQLSHKIILDI